MTEQDTFCRLKRKYSKWSLEFSREVSKKLQEEGYNHTLDHDDNIIFVNVIHEFYWNIQDYIRSHLQENKHLYRDEIDLRYYKMLRRAEKELS